jgi:hypothetical protein
MTAKKKPRTGGDGASSNSLHGDDESWGNFPSPQFYDRAVNIERQPARAAPACHQLALPIAASGTLALERRQRRLG